ncbi:MAG: hypothetical protein ACKOE2_04095, partial [Actinomycetales bacterium]
MQVERASVAVIGSGMGGSTLAWGLAQRGVQFDAACVVVNLFDLPGRPAVREACLRNVLAAR